MMYWYTLIISDHPFPFMILHSCLVHLSRLEVAVDMYAPDAPQMHVIDHCKGEPAQGETRFFGAHL